MPKIPQGKDATPKQTPKPRSVGAANGGTTTPPAQAEGGGGRDTLAYKKVGKD